MKKHYFVFYIIFSFLLLSVFSLDLVKVINDEVVYYKDIKLTGVSAYALLGFVFLMLVVTLREGYLSFRKHNKENEKR